MSVPSAKKSSYTSRKRALTHKRRQNQNAEISELASLVPLSMLPSSVEGSHAAGSLVPSNGHNSPAMDKLSVLRLVSSYLKLQQFMKETTHVDSNDVESTKHQFGVIEKAIDGFLIVLDKDANILYVSETIIDCVGLRQQDVIGQSLVDITHSTSAVEITDGLKPSVAFPSSVAQSDGVFSQFRQFYVRFKSTVYNSRITSHTMIQVNGNLKVKLPPSKVPVSSSSGEMELVEPSVVSFIGECHRIESDCSAMDVVLPLTTFSWTKTLDRKLISIDPTFKDIIGYDPEKLIDSNNNIGKDLVHPGDSHMLEPMRQYFLRTGHVVSPLMRVLNSSGEWVLMTIETTLRYDSGTAIPLFLEFKARVISPGIGKVKYAVHRKPHNSASNGVSDTDNPATEDGDNTQSTKSKNNKERMTKASGVEVLKGVNLPDSIRDVLLTSIREHAKPAPSNDDAARCESTAKDNKCSSGISSKESQLGHEVLDPNHDREHQPSQFLVDQLPAAKTQGTFMSGSSSASSPVSIATSSGNPDSSQAPSFSKRLTCSSAAQPGSSSSSPLAAHDQIQAQSGAISCTGIEKPHIDKDSTPVDSHSTSEDMEQGDKFGSESQTGLPSRSRHPDSPPDNVSSQGSCDLDFNFPSCAAPCVDAPSNSTEHVPNLEELMMPGVQNLTLNDQSNHCDPITQQVLGDIDDPSSHCDPIMQQVLGDIDIMNNDFNLEVGNSMASDPNGSKSSSMYSCSILPRTNFLASIIPDPESLQRDPNIMTNELNHEVHDILQQFM